jgi:hypothetical protein
MHLPVFPLPIFLLPDGVTRLRIFEPRYIKLVSIACKGQGFALCIFDPKSEYNVPKIGVWVEIINFSQEGELLHIDIKGKSLIELNNVIMDEEKLRFADCCEIPHWPQQALQPIHNQLAEKLKRVYYDYPAQGELYPDPNFDNPNWVCSRFLEILPLSFEKRQLFIDTNSFPYAEEFLQTMLLENDN